jgi:hypothetical protein
MKPEHPPRISTEGNEGNEGKHWRFFVPFVAFCENPRLIVKGPCRRTGQISVSAPANGILAVDVIAVTLHLDC